MKNVQTQVGTSSSSLPKAAPAAPAQSKPAATPAAAKTDASSASASSLSAAASSTMAPLPFAATAAASAYKPLASSYWTGYLSDAGIKGSVAQQLAPILARISQKAGPLATGHDGNDTAKLLVATLANKSPQQQPGDNRRCPFCAEQRWLLVNNPVQYATLLEPMLNAPPQTFVSPSTTSNINQLFQMNRYAQFPLDVQPGVSLARYAAGVGMPYAKLDRQAGASLAQKTADLGAQVNAAQGGLAFALDADKFDPTHAPHNPDVKHIVVVSGPWTPGQTTLKVYDPYVNLLDNPTSKLAKGAVQGSDGSYTIPISALLGAQGDETASPIGGGAGFTWHKS